MSIGADAVRRLIGSLDNVSDKCIAGYLERFGEPERAAQAIRAVHSGQAFR